MKIAKESLSDSDLAELLALNPKALYRPLLVHGDQLVIGFKPDAMEELLATL